MSNGKQRITISRADARRLEDWVVAHRNELMNSKLTMPQLVIEVSRQNGFQVTPSSLRKAAEVMGVTIRTVGSAGGNGPNVRVSGLFPIIEVLDGLMRRAGYTPPQHYTEYVASLRRANDVWESRGQTDQQS